MTFSWLKSQRTSQGQKQTNVQLNLNMALIIKTRIIPVLINVMDRPFKEEY